MRPGTTHPDRGDGPPCPEPGDHGRTYQVFGFAGKGEYWWCPVTQELFDITDHGHGIGKALRVKVEVAEPTCVGMVEKPPVPVKLPSGRTVMTTTPEAFDLDDINLEDFA